MKDLQSIAKNALEALREQGADLASCVISETETNELTAETEGLTLLRTLFDQNAGLTGIAEGRKGTGSVNRLDAASLRAAAAETMEGAKSAEPDSCWELASEGGGSIAWGPQTCDLDRLLFRTQELLDTIEKDHPTLTVSQLVAAHTSSRAVYANTNGVFYELTSGHYSFSLEVTGHRGDKTSSFNYCQVEVLDLDRPILEQGNMPQTLRNAEQLIDPPAMHGKFQGTVVFTPDILPTMLYYAVMKFASDESMIQGTTAWKDKLGQRVADPAITFGSHPLDARIAVGEQISGEGYRSENYNIVEHGVLKQMALSQYAANKTGGVRAPNDDLSLVMEPGTTPLRDLIRSIDHGLLAGYYSGGKPSSSGDFSGVAKNSYLIEHGELKPISEVMISGNLAEMLNHLVGISQETVCDGTMVMPWAAFDGITIAGN